MNELSQRVPSTKVLVVEDDTNVAEVLTRYLRREGYEVTCLGDGLAARPDRPGVRPAGVPGPPPAGGLHPRAAPRPRLGLPGRRQLDGDGPRPAPSPEGRGRPGPPHPPEDGVGRRLPFRGLNMRP